MAACQAAPCRQAVIHFTLRPTLIYQGIQAMLYSKRPTRQWRAIPKAPWEI
jgi:hypothetical protein